MCQHTYLSRSRANLSQCHSLAPVLSSGEGGFKSMDFFNPELFSLTQWEWWVLIAIGMLILEVCLPGAVFIWPGLAAAVMAVIVANTEYTWQTYSMIFAILTIVFGVLARPLFIRLKNRAEGEVMNEDHNHLTGSLCQVLETVSATQGRVKLKDSSYSARLADGQETIEYGTMVKVVRVKGTTLFVAPFKEDEAGSDSESEQEQD